MHSSPLLRRLVPVVALLAVSGCAAWQGPRLLPQTDLAVPQAPASLPQAPASLPLTPASPPPAPASLPPAPAVETVASPAGYRFPLPAGWRRDPEAPPVVTRLLGPGAELEIFDQPLAGTDAETYIGYSNRSVLAGWSGLQLLDDRRTRVAGLPARVLDWTRPVLARLPGDRNVYREVAVQRGGEYVYTFLLKSTEGERERAVAALDGILARLHLTAAAPPAPVSAWPAQPGGGRDWQQAMAGGHLRWEPPAPGVLWGLYDPLLAPGEWQLGRLREYERTLDTKFGFVMTYQSFGYQRFPAEEIREAANDGRLTMLTLQSWRPIAAERVYSEPTTLTLGILNGEFDQFLHQYARAAKELSEPFFFRFDNEMNADWCPWGAFQYGLDTALYRAAWRYVWEIFQAEGASNAIFVWNPNDRAFPDYHWNHAAMYWPGAAYVDWVGLTGYNVGDAYEPGPGRSFHDAYAGAYAEYTRLYPGKPLLITEFASHDSPRDKAEWIRRITPDLQQHFPQVKIAVWWNGTDGKRNYRLDTSAASRQAFIDQVHDPYAVNAVRYEP